MLNLMLVIFNNQLEFKKPVKPNKKWSNEVKNLYLLNIHSSSFYSWHLIPNDWQNLEPSFAAFLQVH